jgi:hypothetical protein
MFATLATNSARLFVRAAAEIRLCHKRMAASKLNRIHRALTSGSPPGERFSIVAKRNAHQRHSCRNRRRSVRRYLSAIARAPLQVLPTPPIMIGCAHQKI